MTVHAPEQVESEATGDPVGPRPGAQSRRPLVAGGFVGLWALVVGVAVVTALVMLSWTLAPNAGGDSAAAWRASGLAWLAAHHVPLTISGQPLSLLPLGALLLPLLLTRRGGAWTGRLLPEPTPVEMAQIVVGAGLAYAAGGAAVAWLSSASGTGASLLPASLVTGVVAMAGTTWGVAREGDLVGRLRNLLPESVWSTLVGALAAVAATVAVGAVLTALNLVLNIADVATVLTDFEAGPAGAAGIALLSALSLPNLALWMASVAAGPGFQIGATGSMSAFGGELGTLPAFPVLAVVPANSPAWAPLFLVIPVLAGVLASRIRWGRDLPTVSGALLAALGVAGVAAVLTAALMWLSGGALGAGQLSWVGPLVLPVTAATVVLVCLGFLGETGGQALRLVWTLHRSEQSAGIGSSSDLSEPGELGSGRESGVRVETVSRAPDDPAADEAAAEDSAASDPAPSGALAASRRLAGRFGGASGAVGSRLTGAGAMALAVIVGPPEAADEQVEPAGSEAAEPVTSPAGAGPDPASSTDPDSRPDADANP